MQKQAVRLGVDIGGTFTDVVLERGDALFSTKVLTTYRAPEEAIVEGMARVCAQAQVNPGEITQIIHGTTLATNALIERRGAGRHRGGLGQYMEVGAQEGYEFDIQAMFDRVNHPANGRQGGSKGGATTIALDDGAPMRGKGKQFVPHGKKVMMAFPGGAGYGPVCERSTAETLKDLAGGYITAQAAEELYGLAPQQIADVLERAKNGETF